MPNWCENSLTVTGPPEELQTFRKKARGRGARSTKKDPVLELSFHSTVPMPKKVTSAKDDSWYNWSITNWGTKWDANDVRLDENPGSLYYRFETAWSPPIPWLEATAKQFPKLQFRLFYAEGGNYFAGVATAEGDSFCDETLDYVEANIDEYGSYSTVCEECDNDVELHDKSDPRVCADCLKHRCAHCHQRDDEHVEGKCLFDATEFLAMGDKQDETDRADVPREPTVP